MAKMPPGKKPGAVALPGPNVVDRVIGYFSPREGARRMAARTQMALLGGYVGARRDRPATGGWKLPAGSPESDVISDLQELRDRCADLERNAPVGAAIINTNAEHVVGTGLACNPQIDAQYLRMTSEQADAWQADVRRRFRAWCSSPDCDVARTLNFYAQQDLVLRSTLSRGDVFALTPRLERNGRTRLAVQLIEADRVCNPNRRQNTATLTEGIEHDPVTGEPIRCHVASHHPGDLRAGALSWTPIDYRGTRTQRRNVLHIFKQLRPELRRGVPLLAPVIEPIKQVSKYSEAELHAAVASAVIAVILEMDGQAFADFYDPPSQQKIVDRADRWSGELETGQAINLMPGEKPHVANFGRPNAQFDPFVSACFRQIGMAVGMPYEVLVMAYQSSYSAAKGALLMAWRGFMNRRDWLATQYCQPIYELWLADEVSEGRVSAPGFFANDVMRAAWCGAQWVGDGPGSLDPLKDATAAEKRLAVGISTLQSESIAYDGVDWETKHRQQVKEAQQREAAGLTVHGARQAAPSAMPGAQPAGRPNPAEPDRPDPPDGSDPPNPDDTSDDDTGT